MKRIICKIKGHDLESKSITKMISGKCWCKRCKRCGQYVLKSDIGCTTISKKSALEFKEDFEEQFKFIYSHLNTINCEGNYNEEALR